jgi:hypothetical protein
VFVVRVVVKVVNTKSFNKQKIFIADLGQSTEEPALTIFVLKKYSPVSFLFCLRQVLIPTHFYYFVL